MDPAATHTFLFTDLVGFTAFAEDEGDDRAAEVAIRFEDEVAALLARHRASQVKALGDGVMLRCEDPSDGVALGLAIVDAAEHAALPAVRVGLHSGTAVERRGDWFGTTVNTAARLCAAAGSGEVLVSETAVRAAGALEDVELGPRRLHFVRNLREPVPARLAARPEPQARRRGLLAWLAPRPQGPRIEVAGA